MTDVALHAFARRLRSVVSRTPFVPRGDAELLARFAGARDEQVFTELVGRYGRLVRNVCRNVPGDEQDAEEAKAKRTEQCHQRASHAFSP
jgi:hypothetical protein